MDHVAVGRRCPASSPKFECAPACFREQLVDAWVELVREGVITTVGLPLHVDIDLPSPELAAQAADVTQDWAVEGDWDAQSACSIPQIEADEPEGLLTRDQAHHVLCGPLAQCLGRRRLPRPRPRCNECRWLQAVVRVSRPHSGSTRA